MENRCHIRDKFDGSSSIPADDAVGPHVVSGVAPERGKKGKSPGSVGSIERRWRFPVLAAVLGCVLRDAPLGLLSMRKAFAGIKIAPHAEERSTKRVSKHTGCLFCPALQASRRSCRRTPIHSRPDFCPSYGKSDTAVGSGRSGPDLDQADWAKNRPKRSLCRKRPTSCQMTSVAAMAR